MSHTSEAAGARRPGSVRWANRANSDVPAAPTSVDGDGPRYDDRGLLAVGGITDRKQPLELVRAAARLLDHHPDLHLAFVGDGPLADRIAPLAAELGIHTEANP